jgi:diguanylate cyclase (GGDEF)-like protein
VAPIALSAVFKAHPDVVVVVGIDGRVIMHNPAAERLFELESDITGAPFDQLVARFDHGGDSTEPDGDLWRLDGRWYELRCVPVVEGRAEQARAYVWREVTAFIETQQELRVAAKLMEERLDANLRLHEQLREMALRDSLTGLHNRRILEDVGDRLIANADATQMPLSVVSLDLDHFKQLNDTHGHKAGDDALVLVSSILNRSLRPNEVAIRMGGEEFLVLMPDVDAETAVARAEAWQTLLASMPVPTPRGETVVHFSAGVATYPTHASTFAALLQKVDRAVYSAKNAGRDRVVISRPKQVRVA